MKNEEYNFETISNFAIEEALKTKEYQEMNIKQEKFHERARIKNETTEEFSERMENRSKMYNIENKIIKTYLNDNIRIVIDNFFKIGFYNNKFYIISELPDEFNESTVSIITFESFKEMLIFLKIKEIKNLSKNISQIK